MTVLEMKEKNNKEEIVRTALEKAKQSQDALNAVVSFVEVDKQLEELKEKETSLPFYGVPIALKDNVSTKGIRTTASSRILDDYIPVFDAHIVKKLKEAGAVIIAKTSMDELGMGGTNLSAYTGPVLNPYDTSRISGGSSGGSAALVAAGVVPFAIGSDTGDSVRKPASFCGVVGMKPTYGRISRYGIIPYASSLDHVAYFTRSVKDAALSLEVLAGRDDNDITSSQLPVETYLKNCQGDLKGKRIVVLKNVVDSIGEERIVASFEELITKMEEAGAIVTSLSMDRDLLRSMVGTYYIISNCEATANHSNLDGLRFGVQESGEDVEDVMTNSRTKGLSTYIRKRFVIGGYGLSEENQERLFKKAQRVRRKLVDEFQALLKDADVVIAPASGQAATKLEGASAGDPLSDECLIAENYLVLGNFSGYPSITVPMCMVDGLPVGVNLTSKPFTESELFNIAFGVENITGYYDCKAEVEA